MISKTLYRIKRASILQSLELPFNDINKWGYVLSATLFVFVFLSIYQPFDLSNTFFVSRQIDSSSISFMLSEITVVFLSLSISQFYLREKLFTSKMTIKRHILLFFMESVIILCLTFLIGLFSEYPETIEQNLIQNQFLNTLFIFGIHIFILVFPFIGIIFYYKLKQLTSQKNKLQDEIVSLVKEKTVLDLSYELKISNDKDIIELKIELKNLLFLESSNQYVKFYYIKDNKIQQKLIYNRLRTFLEEFKDLQIVQCHRSYAVNLEKVKSIKIIQGKRYLIFTDNLDYKVPISKTYHSKIKELLLSGKAL